nr:hypothetical protein DA06_18640 [Georgenia sp. SUBG003]
MVCTRNVSAPPSATKSGSASTDRWKGRTVGSPTISVSRSARRARSMAWARVAPVTMILASIESNAPETESPPTTPESTRTPGPDGHVRDAIVPGAGMNPDAGSSPLMRSSMEWPRGATES